MADKKLTFEAAMARLETIVTLLERGEAPLEDSLALFEEGTAMLRQCSTSLDKAEQKVLKLTSAAANGPVTEPFEGEK